MAGMSDQGESRSPFYAPDNPGAFASERQRAPGELVWTMTKGGHVYHAELRPGPQGRCELQILLDNELRVAHMHVSREWALAEADLRQETLRVKGWTAPEQPVAGTA